MVEIVPARAVSFHHFQDRRGAIASREALSEMSIRLDDWRSRRDYDHATPQVRPNHLRRVQSRLRRRPTRIFHAVLSTYFATFRYALFFKSVLLKCEIVHILETYKEYLPRRLGGLA